MPPASRSGIQYPGPGDRPGYGKYTQAFTVGRGEDYAVRLLASRVSRHHVGIFPQDGSWWARDLESSNGTLVNGRPIDRLPLVGTVTLELGQAGPRIRVTAPPPPAPAPDEGPRSLEDVSRHYLDAASETPAGEHTMLIRRAFKDVRRRQSRTYLALIFGVVLMLTAVSGVALFQYLQLQKMAGLANDIFYDMKELELHVANLESDLERDREDIRSARLGAEIAASKRKLARMREKYDAYVHELRTSRLIPPDSEELLILRLAKIFGETEVAVSQALHHQGRGVHQEVAVVQPPGECNPAPAGKQLCSDHPRCPRRPGVAASVHVCRLAGDELPTTRSRSDEQPDTPSLWLR